ncbi:MAG: bifunctional (p)ppGpp synthetase/guanosine-3',5'-bis(diphosphate) 3'-pyrophosphohydrolase [Chloroflexi bacterium]|nr:bifunctional (p)ppGpp synthetase/guanosine-3',5'-bis(diphosphate) 3'-pyrophosphohydrolase [Chloroflexota bacterium]MCL5950194.1 bifunctional (p)ppGpp synthetase/guanosine-3',5'-bis(diphosphate) 3'-pyrophosphohydrolase [Chloroflexota bacterium]
MEIHELVIQVQSYNPEADATRLERAYELARGAHDGQTRSTGDPYITHALSVAGILADLHMDEDSIIAGLLHDVPEDTSVTLDTIRKQFGEDVAKLVDGVTKLSQLRLGMEQEEAESLRKMFLAMAEEIRVVLIKLADRLHNMRTLYALPPNKQRKIARETMEIYAPLANRLGIYNIRRELEDLSFKYLEPTRYQEIEALLAADKDDQQAYIAQAITILRDHLAQDEIAPLEISGRPKHIYSIYNKMVRKNRDFDQIYDIRAIRVIVENLRDCYVVLGVVHSLWTPIPGEFDDFIAKPKENLYQSLHTAVIGPAGKPLEVQIRTADMHRIAEYGIAAHWRYKEAGLRHDAALENKINWLRQLMEWRKDISDASTFVDSIKTDEFQDQVYVFTPKGDIIEMATGATPIDFAYHVHTEVGHRCRGAKVNGKIVPLDYRLRTGDRVEILTAKKGGPSRDWLNPGLGLVRTVRAQQKIRQWFKHQERTEAIAEGRELLDKELRRLGLDQRNLEEIAKFFSFKTVDDFLEAIGHEDISLTTISVKLLEAERAKTETPVEEPPPAPVLPKAPETSITVEGVGDVLQRLAHCCNPLPGDDVIGFITRGRGITIHRRDCKNILEMDTDRERLIMINWKQTDQQAVYPVLVRVEAFDRSGLVHDISGIVAAEAVSMTSTNAVVGRKDHIAVITATLEISSAGQLTRILNKIDHLPNVIEARRVTS